METTEQEALKLVKELEEKAKEVVATEPPADPEMEFKRAVTS